MHKYLFQWLALAVLIVLLAACGDAAAPALEANEEVVPVEPAVESTSIPASPSVNIEIATGAETRAFSLEELQQLPVTEGYAGIKSSTGRITLF